MSKGFHNHRFIDSSMTAEHKNICSTINGVKVLFILSFLLIVVVTSFQLKSGASRTDDGYDIRGQNKEENLVSAVALKLSRSILHRHTRQTNKDICSSNITVTSHGGTITSPDFPNLYPSNQDCRWLLTAPDDNRIVLKIATLNLELIDDCYLDYLKIYFGPSETDSSIGPFCGIIKDRVIHSNSSTVSIAFHSDSTYEAEGFSIEYYIESVEACGGNLTASSGIITSPLFPKNYPSNLDCWTLISVAENNTIFMQFDLLDMEFDENCLYDYVEVFDGFTKDSVSLGRFCSNTHKLALQSSSNVLLLHFKSDLSINGMGFQAQYSSIPWILHKFGKSGDCLWERNLINGTITSPSSPEKYANSSYCKILLTAPLDHVITVFFERLQLEVNCSCDYVEVRDGFMENSILLGKYCGEFNETKEITSSQERLQITFNSNECTQFPRFIARYYFQNKVSAVTTSNESEDEYIFIEVPQNATLPAGGSYYLPCVSKITSANISWLKDDKYLQEKTTFLGLKMMVNNTLWIKSMNRHLIGVYTCTAVVAEKTFYAKAWVNMETDSAINDTVCNIVLKKIPKDTSFTEGEFSYLECLAPGRQIEYSWEKNGAPLETKQHITMLQNGFLLFDRTTVEDSGVYTCIISDLILGCQKRVDAVLTIRRKLNMDEICGRPKLNKITEEESRLSHGFIVGGHDSEKGAHPWQVMLWDPKLKSFCGGSLLNEYWIVTAAHCFRNKNIKWNQIVIKLGKLHREEDDDEEIETNIEDSSSIILHPGFNNVTFDNDIALVRMNDYINITNYILPICLGEQHITENLFQDSQPKMGTVTGWGKLKHDIDRSIIRQWEKEKYKMAQQQDLPTVLQEIRLPIVNYSICVHSTRHVVTRNMFCAGYDQEVIGDSCQGDSGGPFAMEFEGKWYLIGVVSWGEECGKPGKYGFYTKISNYMPWIKAITKT